MAKETIKFNGEILTFKKWRIQPQGIELPALMHGEVITIPAEATFVNEKGEEVGISPDAPFIRNKWKAIFGE